MATSVLPGQRPDRMEEECAVFGVYAPGEDVARLTCYGLQALQHRGQESAGIAVGDGSTVMAVKDLGLVTQVFNDANLAALSGNLAVGHCRYSTSGGAASWEAAQPHISAIDDVLIALAHNGTLVNTAPARQKLKELGVHLRSATDSEVAAKMIGTTTQQTHHLRDGIKQVMSKIHGAYAMLVATPHSLYAFRDPNGIRPLVVGELPQGRGWVFSSETCGLDIVGATYVRDVEPGEIIRVNEDGFESVQGIPAGPRASCIFEFVYFARPDSVMDGHSVYQTRRRMGRILANEAPVEADLVMGVPDSGIPAAMGYAAESGLPYMEGLVKNRYVGRTFIQPTQELRQLGIRLKLNPLPSVIRGKRLVVIDDSIVRGNTSKKLVSMLREAGAKEVHLRIVSPEVMWPCFYGIDTDTQDQLISANNTLQETCDFIGADSLAFISIEGLRRAIVEETHTGMPEAFKKARNSGFCEACFTGAYPVEIPQETKEKSFLPHNR